MDVPFLPRDGRLAGMASDLPDVILSHCESGQFILKNSVAELEARTASHFGSLRHGIATSSYFGATSLGLRAMGCGPDDHILVPEACCAEFAAALRFLGAKPMPYAIRADGGLAVGGDARLARAAYVTGASADTCEGLERIRTGFNDKPLLVDGWFTLETIGQSTAFADADVVVIGLNPTTPLPTIGEAAMVLTGSGEIAQACRMLRNHGQDGKTRFLHHRLGFNFRMDEITAALALSRLPALPQDLSGRRATARAYDRALEAVSARLRPKALGATEYTLRAPNSLNLVRALARFGIEARPSSQSTVKFHDGFPGTDVGAEDGWVAIPFHSALSPNEAAHVSSSILSLLAEVQ